MKLIIEGVKQLNILHKENVIIKHEPFGADDVNTGWYQDELKHWLRKSNFNFDWYIVLARRFLWNEYKEFFQFFNSNYKSWTEKIGQNIIIHDVTHFSRTFLDKLLLVEKKTFINFLSYVFPCFGCCCSNGKWLLYKAKTMFSEIIFVLFFLS